MEGLIKCFPDNVKLKELIITKPLLYEILKGYLSKKKKIKNMNSKMTTSSQLSTTEPKNQNKTNKVSKKLEQEQIHRNRDHMEGYQWVDGEGRMGEKYRE